MGQGGGHETWDAETGAFAAVDAGLTLPPTARLLSLAAAVRRLDISGNALNEEGLSALGGLRALQRLSLARCGLSGFPTWACALPRLTRLDLARNQIGEVPDAVVGLRALQCLVLSHNRLAALPAALSRAAMPALLMVTIDGNAIDAAALPACGRELLHGAAQQRVAQRVLPGVWLGSRYAAGLHGPPELRESLRAMGVTHVLTVGGGMPPPFPDAFAYHVIDVHDTPAADLLTHLPAAVAFVAGAVAAGGGVLAHCSHGQSRSAAVVAAYAAGALRCGADEAVALVRERRYVAAPNEGFLRQLREFVDGAGGGTPLAAPHQDAAGEARSVLQQYAAAQQYLQAHGVAARGGAGGGNPLLAPRKAGEAPSVLQQYVAARQYIQESFERR